MQAVPSNNSEGRLWVLRQAHSWLGTPFHHAQMTKGQGVDCAMLLCAVYSTTGCVPLIDPRPYPPDWHMHRDAERFLGHIAEHAQRVEFAMPGDIALFRYGRCVSHGAIIEDDDYMIHAWVDAHAVVRSERRALAERLDSYWSVFA